MATTTIFTRLTVTVSSTLADRLATIRETHGVSVSAVVEHAVAHYFAQTPQERIAENFRANGVSLRRSR
ncbi:MAG: ribbon-helix-helix protein, CopG family [Candidatus Eremiobacteraeota bacterium]|nr:ribbon-helix-helix protein, CopG family [Candidatus Eremiobacteraeota bacterium]